MLVHRPFASLGRFDNEWLSARYHFSFSGYYDPNRMGWGALRVWNDDRIKAQSGFPPHGHKDMEIITYVRKGAISHGDSQGNRGRTGAGEIQVMSAGTGIRHSEMNLEDEDTELFQIWIEPSGEGFAPRWEARSMPEGSETPGLVPLASGQGKAGALAINQDATLYVAHLAAGSSLVHAVGSHRGAYLVGLSGAAEIEGVTLNPRDGLAVAELDRLNIRAESDSSFLLCDVPH